VFCDVSGPPGFQGLTGATGATGTRGSFGRPGFTGYPGARGYTGPPGLPGGYGPRGPSGDPGFTGMCCTQNSLRPLHVLPTELLSSEAKFSSVIGVKHKCGTAVGVAPLLCKNGNFGFTKLRKPKVQFGVGLHDITSETASNL